MTQAGLFDSMPRPRKRVNVPATSVEAYLSTDQSGRIEWVCEWLKGRYVLTSAEIARDMHDGLGSAPLHLVMQVRRALSDALAAGLVEHAGQRKCAVSGRTCLTWKLRSR